jgi:hypothetical protein
MDSKQNFQILLAEGTKEAEITIREGQAVKQLEPKAPVKTNLTGTITAPFEYLKKRIDAEQFEQKRSHILVNLEKIKILLVFNEDDEYLRGTVLGELEFNSKFLEFGINSSKAWTPSELGLFIKMNKSFFPDKTANMKLVSDLMNFTATVNNSIQRAIKESGDRTDNFSTVVNSNLPPSFLLDMQIFKGAPSIQFEVETFAHVNGRDVSFILLSPAVNSTVEEIRNSIIDDVLKNIIEIAPDIVIIEQ